MGLDITAYSHIEDIGVPPEGFEWWELDVLHLCADNHDSFHRSGRSLINNHLYRETDESRSTGFRAGSYSSYNYWRSDLAKFTTGHTVESYWGTEGDINLPFYELINFTDCDGVIGWEAAADLLTDFNDHYDAYTQTHEAWDTNLYECWTEACKVASDNGLIWFH